MGWLVECCDPKDKGDLLGASSSGQRLREAWARLWNLEEPPAPWPSTAALSLLACSFTQQTISKWLLHARHCSGPGNPAVTKQIKFFVIIGASLVWGPGSKHADQESKSFKIEVPAGMDRRRPRAVLA